MSTGNRIVDLKLFHQYVLYMVFFSFFVLFSCVTYPFKVSVFCILQAVKSAALLLMLSKMHPSSFLGLVVSHQVSMALPNPLKRTSCCVGTTSRDALVTAVVELGSCVFVYMFWGLKLMRNQCSSVRVLSTSSSLSKPSQ